MTSLEKCVQALESNLSTADGLSYAERLRAAEQRARERRHLGLPDPLPSHTNEGTGPLADRLMRARERAQALHRTFSA
jgi:hypothetical protein